MSGPISDSFHIYLHKGLYSEVHSAAHHYHVTNQTNMHHEQQVFFSITLTSNITQLCV